MPLIYTNFVEVFKDYSNNSKKSRNAADILNKLEGGGGSGKACVMVVGPGLINGGIRDQDRLANAAEDCAAVERPQRVAKNSTANH